MKIQKLALFIASLIPPFPLPIPLAGQSIHGRVLVEADTVGIDGVTLTVSDSSGLRILTHHTDPAGSFRIGLDDPGLYRISATRLGYSSTRAMVRVLQKEMVVVEMRMAQQPIPLEPLEIVARRRIREGTLDEFYDRMARNQRKGRGHFITRDEIEGSGGASIPYLLHRVPGIFLRPAGVSGTSVRMRAQGRYCTPQLFIDGRPQDYGRMPDIIDLEGVEVYKGRWEPVEGYWDEGCGMIFLWRKEGWGNPFSWRRALLFGGFGGIFAAIAFLE